MSGITIEQAQRGIAAGVAGGMVPDDEAIAG